VTRRELLAAGITDDELRWRLGTGALIRVHRGVYRVGHDAPSTAARYLAAVRACGEDALLSGRAAAHLLGLTKGRPPGPEVSAPTERRIPGIKTRRAPALARDERTLWRGIPVTSVARTLVDLAAVLDAHDLARACHEAGVRYRTTPAEVERVLERRLRAPGRARLRAVVSGDIRVALSKLEARFLQLLREAGLPLPLTNRPAGGRRVDCRWPAHRLTVELDSYRYHHSRHSWEQDRLREREAYRRGDQFRRYTWGDVFERQQPMLTELSKLLE
jgi:hypothetical protein